MLKISLTIDDEDLIQDNKASEFGVEVSSTNQDCTGPTILSCRKISDPQPQPPTISEEQKKSAEEDNICIQVI